MASAIIVLGNNLTLNDFRQLQENSRIKRSPFFFYMPVETVLPICLDNPEKYDHAEGILTAITSQDIAEGELEKNLRNWVVATAKQLEQDYCDYHQRGEVWAYQNGVKLESLVPDSKLGGSTVQEFQAYYYILRLWPGEINFDEYCATATELISRTKEARIRRYTGRQEFALKEAIKTVSQKDPGIILL